MGLTPENLLVLWIGFSFSKKDYLKGEQPCVGKTEVLLSAHTDWLQLCSPIFALNCFFLGALLHHTLQFKPGAPEIILIEISAFSSNQKEEVL